MNKIKPRAYMRNVIIGETRVNVMFMSHRPSHIVARDYMLQRVRVSTPQLVRLAAQYMLDNELDGFTLRDAAGTPVACVSRAPRPTHRRSVILDTAVH